MSYKLKNANKHLRKKNERNLSQVSKLRQSQK